MKQVLFLCSANFYRSRFAEHVFNWLAPQAGLSWRADSRGLMVGNWGQLTGMSHFTVNALKERGIALDGPQRNPIALSETDLETFDLVVAVKESEHREPMAEQFPDWANRIEYWHIDDLDCAQPEDALPNLEKHIRALIDRLGLADRHHAPSRKAGVAG
jgi:protein-tyrosine phosphatase